MSELKPCPFCGGKAKVHKKHNKFYVECDGDCWTQTSKYSYQEDAIQEWNGQERRKEENVLLPCPFCGGEAKVEIVSLASWDEFVPHCKNPKCVAFYLGYIDEGLYKTEAEAIKAWNRRVSE